jgi:hypothetical protein
MAYLRYLLAHKECYQLYVEARMHTMLHSSMPHAASNGCLTQFASYCCSNRCWCHIESTN